MPNRCRFTLWSSPATTKTAMDAPHLVNVVTRPSLGQLLTLAWPVVITRSAQVVVGITDGVMCSRLGQDALAATTTGATNTFVVLVLFMGTSFIVSSFSSQLIGARDPVGARRYGFYGLILAAVAAVC